MKKIMPILCLALAACSSAEEKLCRAKIDASLINPETAQYSEYRDLNAQDIGDNEYWSYLPDAMSHVIPKDGARYAAIKVRAEGKLGNVITSHRFCGINAERTDCFCLDAG